MCWSVAEVLSTYLASLPDRCVRPPQSGLVSHHYSTWPFAHAKSWRAGNKVGTPRTDTYTHSPPHKPTHITHDHSEWQWLLFTPALPPSLSLLSSSPSSLSCCVSLPTNVSATVGQWLILVCLAKCLQDVCLGCLFPPPRQHLLPISMRVLASWVESGKHPSSVLYAPLTPPCHILLFSGGKERLIIFDEGQRLPELTEIFFSDQSCFLSLDHSAATNGSTTVCLVCAAGVWWEKSWPGTGGAATLHCQRGWLAYHSLR